MRRVLVTGARGFVGSRTLRGLLEAGDDVHGVTSRVSGSSRGAEDRGALVLWHRVDLLDPDATSALMARVRPTHLLHLAWYTEPGSFWTSTRNFRWVEASLALVRAFAECGGRRAVITGTCAEYDWTTTSLALREDSPCRPATPYGVAKYALGELLMSQARLTDLSLGWGRLFHLHGPEEDPRRLIAATISALARGDLARCSDGEQRRDFLHVQDVADALVAFLHSSVEGPVNIASGQAVSVRQVVGYIARMLKAESLLQFGVVPRQPNEPATLVADVRRLRVEVQWSPRFDFERGLDDSIAGGVERERARSVMHANATQVE